MGPEASVLLRSNSDLWLRCAPLLVVHGLMKEETAAKLIVVVLEVQEQQDKRKVVYRATENIYFFKFYGVFYYNVLFCFENPLETTTTHKSAQQHTE